MDTHDRSFSGRALRWGVPLALLATTAGVVLLAMLLLYGSFGGWGNVSHRDVQTLAKWQQGDVVLVQSDWGRDRAYLLEWRNEEESLQMTGRYATPPTAQVLPDHGLGLIVGEPGDWNLQVLQTPRGPRTAQHYSNRADAEKELQRLAARP